MGQVGTKLRSASSARGHKQLMHWCPACDEPHGVYIVNPDGRPVWTFNGDYERPTFSPSIRCFTTEREDDDGKPLPAPVERTLCHYHIVAGEIRYCGDSPHALAGKNVPLPDWPYAPGSYGGLDE